MSDTPRITYDEALLQGWKYRAKSMEIEAQLKITSLIDEIYLLRSELEKARDEAELFRSLSILSDGAIMELERNGQLPDRTEIRARVVHAKATEEHLKQADAQVIGMRDELEQARAALKQIKDLANYDIDHEEDGNTYQIEAIASAALGDK